MTSHFNKQLPACGGRTFPAVVFFVAAFLFSCSDDSGLVGTDIMPGQDIVSTSQATYKIVSRSLKVDSVLANTGACYLGRVVDPETRAVTICNFLAQFHVMENYSFPAKERMMLDGDGHVLADSCDIRLYFDEYYGDSLATMKLHVQELDTANVLPENINYYSTLDPEEYVCTTSSYRKTLTYAVKDLTRPASETSGTTYYRSVVVKLPVEYGNFLLQKYYENSRFYANSYEFIRHVCPGFYFKTVGGLGAMINSNMANLNVYFSYKGQTKEGNDTIMNGMQRLGATKEVIQNTVVDNELPDYMLAEANDYSYVKSPVGVFTEMTLPIGEIVSGEHYNDTINSAAVFINCYNNANNGAVNLPRPNALLMLRKKDLYTFFEQHKLSDNITSYLAYYSSGTNTYDFTNIGRLVTVMKNDRDSQAGVLPGDTPAVREAKYAAWEAGEHDADWDKVMLVPVKTEVSTTAVTSSLLSIRHDYGLSSVKLAGGTGGNIEMHVVYSRFD
ncbi:MAG: DUF4270 domain-containing protein [Prevotellaceae bacterium]|nr:DUF4270 domain-containing protein [Prevotellaceae bacterium]